MTEDKTNKNEAPTQNGVSGTNKDEGEGSAKVDKKNEAFVQASLSIFSGIIGGMAVNILEDKASWTHVAVILIVGFIVWGVTVFSDKLNKKIGIPILITLLLIAMAVIGCISRN